MILWLLILFVVATVYSSSGLGGLPALMAMLVLMPFTAYETKIIALILNIIVVAYMLIQSSSTKLSKLTDVLIVLITALPIAALVANYILPDSLYFITLGIVFMLTALYIFVSFKADGRRSVSTTNLIVKCALIGLVVGLTGMAGGVLLLPVLAAHQWKDNDEISFFTSLFILLSSLIILFANYKSGLIIDASIVLKTAIAVLAGTMIGKRLEFSYITPNVLRNMTALFMLLMGMKLCFEHYEQVGLLLAKWINS